MIYKVSYVEETGQYPGGIKNVEQRPQIGDHVQIGPRQFQIIAVQEILPPRDDFQFLQATIQIIEPASVR